jgi:serine/threonine protein kinase
LLNREQCGIIHTDLKPENVLISIRPLVAGAAGGAGGAAGAAGAGAGAGAAGGSAGSGGMLSHAQLQKEALRHYIHARAIREREGGGQHPLTAVCDHHLGALLLGMGPARNREAQKLLQQAEVRPAVVVLALVSQPCTAVPTATALLLLLLADGR